MFNFINLNKENKANLNSSIEIINNFKDEKLSINYKDYYFSNVISRSSKTMLDCHNSKIKIQKTGTNG